MSKSEILLSILQKVAFSLPLLFLCFFIAKNAWALVLDERDSPSPFGVLDFLPWDHEWNGHHYTPEKVEQAARLMKEAGVGFVRLDFLWDDVQPAKDRWNFEKYDRLVEVLSKNGIKILGLLNYNTAWGGDNWNSAPDADLFAVYAKAMVSRYKNKVKYWEVWNEPNQDIYWVPQDGMKAYTALLKKTYPLIKAEDPSAVVLLGGLSGDAALSLNEVYAHGGRNSFDVVNFHPFENPLDPEAISKMKKTYEAVYHTMEKNQDGKKPIWLTEIGCPGIPLGKETKDWWLGANPDTSQQAAWVEKIFGEPLEWPGVKKVFWAFFRDTPDHFLTGTDYFGLLQEDFTAKPAFGAYQRLTARWKSKGRDQA